MRITTSALLVALTCTSAYADSDKFIGVNLMFNSKGFQGAGLFLSADKVELHAAKLNDGPDYAVGLGYRVIDSEGEGMKNDKDFGMSGTIGAAYVGGTNRGFRPFGQINAEVDLSDDVNLNLGGISYGLNITPTNNYAYAGLAYEDLVDNRPKPEPVVDTTRDATPEPTNTTTDEGGDTTTDGGDTTTDGGTDEGGSGNPNDGKDDNPTDGNAGGGNDTPTGGTETTTTRTNDSGSSGGTDDTDGTTGDEGPGSNSRSGLGDDTNPGRGDGRENSPNQGTNNPNRSR